MSERRHGAACAGGLRVLRRAFIAFMIAVPSLAEVPRAGASFMVMLRSGQHVSSVGQPLIAFGKVRIEPRPGSHEWLPLQSVDVEASKVAWARTRSWRTFDAGDQPLAALPVQTFDSDRGSPVTLPTKGKLTLVELWGEYCPPCWQSLARTSLWYRAERPPTLEVITACVDCEPAMWKRRVAETGLSAIAGWSNVRVSSKLPWVPKVLRGKPKANVLIDERGRVLHWDIDVDAELQRPEVLPTLLASPSLEEAPD